MEEGRRRKKTTKVLRSEEILHPVFRFQEHKTLKPGPKAPFQSSGDDSNQPAMERPKQRSSGSATSTPVLLYSFDSSLRRWLRVSGVRTRAPPSLTVPDVILKLHDRSW